MVGFTLRVFRPRTCCSRQNNPIRVSGYRGYRILEVTVHVKVYVLYLSDRRDRRARLFQRVVFWDVGFIGYRLSDTDQWLQNAGLQDLGL